MTGRRAARARRRLAVPSAQPRPALMPRRPVRGPALLAETRAAGAAARRGSLRRAVSPLVWRRRVRGAVAEVAAVAVARRAVAAAADGERLATISALFDGSSATLARQRATLSTRSAQRRSRRLMPLLLVALIPAVPRPAAAQAHVHPDLPVPDAVGATPIFTPRGRYEVQAARAGQAIEIDGLLSDEAWREAPMIDTFTQQEPENGQPATERTEVRLLYDSSNLYIAVHAFDSEPDHIVATEMRRDSARLLDEDHFEIILDTFRDSRSGYMFVTNPLGAKLEQQIFEEGGGNTRGSASNINKDWNGVWEAAARRTSDGWVAEIAIPVVTVRSPDVPVQTWGINFMRSIRRKNEQVYWSPIPKPFNIMQVSLAGTVTGMTDLNRGLDLRLKPYVTAGTRYDRVGPTSTTAALKDVGADVKYGLGHGLALDLTVNTDFAQAEVDEQQVNLTRFPLFFPEKRDFFLENSGQFTVGTQGLERLMDLFFSRRIGLSDTGQPIDIQGGARLTGKVNGHNVAVMDLQTAEYDGRTSENFLVARYSKDLNRRSRFGGLFINKESKDSTHFNRVAAADVLFAPTRAFSFHT